MMKNHLLLILSCVIVVIISSVFVLNIILTNLIDSTNIVCKGQKFASVDEAIKAMEMSELEANDTSLDYEPPHNVVHNFDYDNNTVVFYTYSESSSYAVRILKHNDDGTLSFDSGFADFQLNEPNGNENYYYFTNIKTNKGNKSISFLYLPKDSDKDIYVDGIKSEKILVTAEDSEFYICYAISKQDTFLTNFLTPVADRHKIVVK